MSTCLHNLKFKNFPPVINQVILRVDLCLRVLSFGKFSVFVHVLLADTMEKAEFNEDLLPDLLPLYYKRLFPYQLFYKWLSYGM